MRSNAAARSASSTHAVSGPLPLHDLVDGLDRVVAAAARPKPVGPRLEPGLPLGLQRVDGPAPAEHRSTITGIPSGRCFPLAFGMYTRLTGKGVHAAASGAPSHRQLGLPPTINATSPSTPGRAGGQRCAPSPAAR